MAKLRVVNTRFWDDDYTANLDPIEKLLFLYFLTNTSTDICGIYEIPLKKVAMDTGIDKEMVQKILDRFAAEGKIFYFDGWVGIKNFIKHQSVNPKVMAGIRNGLAKAPKQIVDSLHIDVDSLSHFNSNLNSNSNINSKAIASVIDAFKSVNPTSYKRWFANKTQREACEQLLSTEGIDLDRVLKVVAILPKTNLMDFIPTINTPLQLAEKWTSLANALTKHKAQLKGKVNAIF